MHTSMGLHFTQVAKEYSNLRTTDTEPIRFITSNLKGHKGLICADVGCGSGRYSMMLSEAYGEQLSLFCCDNSSEMLRELKVQFQIKDIHRFTIVDSPSENIPLENAALDAIFTFNAIHHFQLNEFFLESVRLLVDHGQLFVYTRLAEQNNNSIWGKYFPGFLEKESRLYHQDVIEKELSKLETLELKSVTKFPYKRSMSLERLALLVKQRHYSTFSLYSEKELTSALSQFEDNIRNDFSDTSNIYWEDENIMYHIANNE